VAEALDLACPDKDDMTKIKTTKSEKDKNWLKFEQPNLWKKDETIDKVCKTKKLQNKSNNEDCKL
jgi:hypothetical protein